MEKLLGGGVSPSLYISCKKKEVSMSNNDPMDVFDLVWHVKKKCCAHKVLINIMADPEQRRDLIAGVTSGRNQPLETVAEDLDRQVKECWLLTEDTIIMGNHQAGSRHGRFDIIRFFTEVMECHGRLVRERCIEEFQGEASSGTGDDKQ